MAISVKKDTKFPNASMALAQFFTNPRSMVEFAKNVADLSVVPGGLSTIRSSRPPRDHRGQRPASGQEHHLDVANIVPTSRTRRRQ